MGEAKAAVYAAYDEYDFAPFESQVVLTLRGSQHLALVIHTLASEA